MSDPPQVILQLFKHLFPQYPTSQPTSQVPVTWLQALSGPAQLTLQRSEHPAPYVPGPHSGETKREKKRETEIERERREGKKDGGIKRRSGPNHAFQQGLTFF